MKTVIDQLGNRVLVPEQPKRIISVVPSQTELLHYFGLQDEVIGITKFCIHPESWFRRKARVGGTKQFHHDRIAELQPDLIIGNKEENEQSEISRLMETYPVWMSDIHNLDEALAMIRAVGALVNKSEEAEKLVSQIEAGFSAIKRASESQSVAYFIWREPWMVAGSNTFINDMLERCGLQNAFADREGRYPEVSFEQLKATQPDCLFLSSEPYPFKQKHVAELQAVLPQTRIELVDGELFSWYGSRLLQAPQYFATVL